MGRKSNSFKLRYCISLFILMLLMLPGCYVSTETSAAVSSAETPAEVSSTETSAAVSSAETPAAVSGAEAADSNEAMGGNTEELEVHFLDVGQGDCTLLTCADAAMLIDTGDDTRGTAIRNYLNKQGITRLDYLILTHPDADHIGAAPVIIEKFSIDKVFISNYEKDSKVYQKLVQALDYKRLKAVTPEAGNSYMLGTAKITILAPADHIGTYADANNASIALLVEMGDNTFLFTGDAEEAAEQEILANDVDIRADVYKAGHHGSKSSSGADFLAKIAPAFCVISCGEGNTYGHPHAETLNHLRAMGVQVFRTDEQGTIVAVADGTDITWNSAPTESWIAGEPTGTAAAVTYVLNSGSMKFHRPDCKTLPTSNRLDSHAGREEIISQGYIPCKNCNP